MEVKVVKKDDLSIEFLLIGATPAFANALRRVMMGEVPKMAIDEVEIRKNESSMYDEMLAHRLAMIPLHTDLTRYVLPDECECGGQGCNLCETYLQLQKKGPGMVYSGDLRSSDEITKPVDPNIPIVKLEEGQEIDLIAIARLGLGKDHAKWSPVTICAYRHTPIIRIGEGCDACGACVEFCPRNVLEISDNELRVARPYDCILCKSCVEICEARKGVPYISVEPRKDSFYFMVESDGSLPPEVIVREAVKILESKVNSFLEEISKAS